MEVSRPCNTGWLWLVCFAISRAAGYCEGDKCSTNQHCNSNEMCSSTQFPDDFLFGVGSSSYQVEGAWNEDGKGESIIDNYVRRKPNWTVDSSNGDIACDSYHQYATDVELIKNISADFYRFSISWPRIFPTGDPTNINQAGIDYYNKLIDELLDNGIEPMVTIYHWDLPQALQDLGGWTNRIIVDYFEEFCRILFKNYGDRVSWWVTLNEPQLLAVFGYGQGMPMGPVHPPGIKLPGVADYLTVHHLLLAHARAYHLYKKEFYSEQQGKLGIAANIFGHRPGSTKKEDLEAAQRYTMFEGGWILHPLLSPEGGYPPEFIDRVNKNSKAEGRLKSRLPQFTEEEISALKGTLDFVGLNYYTSLLATNKEIGDSPSFIRDSGVAIRLDPLAKTPGVQWLAFEPEGLRDVLKWIKSNYGNPPVIITENGCDDPNGLNDTERITYHKEHLREMMKAMNEDGCNVIGYTVWSLLDSFEWSSGYTAKFGMYHVDFSDPKRKRTPKLSVKFFKELHETRRLQD